MVCLSFSQTSNIHWLVYFKKWHWQTSTQTTSPAEKSCSLRYRLKKYEPAEKCSCNMLVNQSQITFPSSKHLIAEANYLCVWLISFTTGSCDGTWQSLSGIFSFEIWISTLIRIFIASSLDLKICALSSYSTFISTPEQPHWGWHSVRFQSQVFKACLYRCKIQEMLHLRNWCLCRWNSSIVTISLKWQQCSPDHCLRDDILLNSISFLIIFSCSIHHLSFFSLCCSPLLFSPSLCPKYLPLISPFFFPFCPACDPFHMITFASMKCYQFRLKERRKSSDKSEPPVCVNDFSVDAFKHRCPL